MGGTLKVAALRDFYDVREKVNRKAGDEFEVSAERMAELNACGSMQGGAELVREVDQRKVRGKRAPKQADGAEE